VFLENKYDCQRDAEKVLVFALGTRISHSAERVDPRPSLIY
jgi:hypothetical protein